MDTKRSNDTWKDSLLARENITISEFVNLEVDKQLWILHHKDTFYNTGDMFLNLSHKRNAILANTLRKLPK